MQRLWRSCGATCCTCWHLFYLHFHCCQAVAEGCVSNEVPMAVTLPSRFSWSFTITFSPFSTLSCLSLSFSILSIMFLPPPPWCSRCSTSWHSPSLRWSTLCTRRPEMFWQVVWNHLLHTSHAIAFESSSTRSSHSGQMASSWSEACAFDAVSFDLYPVYTSTFNPERNRFRSHASVYTTPTNPHQRFQSD